MSDCLFCKFVSGEIKPDTLYEDSDVLVFRDINPQAPHHFLAIAEAHVATINDLEPDNAAIMGKLFLATKKGASQLGIAEAGYRTVANCNADGGQTVFHIHLHVLAGRTLSWPPG